MPSRSVSCRKARTVFTVLSLVLCYSMPKYFVFSRESQSSNFSGRYSIDAFQEAQLILIKLFTFDI